MEAERLSLRCGYRGDPAQTSSGCSPHEVADKVSTAHDWKQGGWQHDDVR